MRVAMGLALNEPEREARAIEFYNVLSSFDFMSSTPTLFNSGTHRSQLSSCYLTTVSDDLDGIYEAIKENALLSKFAGGLGNDWTPVRALGSHIKGTNGKSQGVVPFLKVVNDTAVAVNQCFAPETVMYTADGMKPIRDVKRGDLVLGKSGVYREVLRTFVYNQQDPMLAMHVKHAIEPLQVTSAAPVLRDSRRAAGAGRTRAPRSGSPAGQGARGVGRGARARTRRLRRAGRSDGDRSGGWLDGRRRASVRHFAGRRPSVQAGPAMGRIGQSANATSTCSSFARISTQRGIHYWETGRGESYSQIHWACRYRRRSRRHDRPDRSARAHRRCRSRTTIFTTNRVASGSPGASRICRAARRWRWSTVCSRPTAAYRAARRSTSPTRRGR